MAMTINSNLHLQPTDQAALDTEGAETLTIEWKGSYADCRTTADTIATGDDLPTASGGNAYTPDSALYAGYKVRAWTVRRGNGDTAVLAVECRKADATDTSQQGGGGTLPFRTVYSVKSVRNDVSILAYCSNSPSGPNRAAIERWMREPDPKLASEMKYRDENGTEVDITSEPLLKCSVPLIEKIMKGIERVMRFYPQLTIKRQYNSPPTAVFENLAYIDTPPTPSGEKTFAPSGVSTLITSHQWLKVQDDCDEQQDGTWMRTESWIGIATSDNPDSAPWDANLYGPDTDRWKMPHDAGG